jgi:hypothetical protein
MSGRPPSLRDRWVRWWLAELPPLDGRLRLIVYGTLFVVALTHWKSPLRAVALYAETDPLLYRAHGLIAALNLPWLPPAVIGALAIVTGAAWLFAAIGLFGRMPGIVTALGAFALHGLCWGTSAFNHNWYLPVFVLGALAFAAPDPVWSADAAIRRNRGLPPSAPATGLGATGFPRVLALVLCVAFYFCAGITKLQESGLQWTDGHTIAYWGEEDASKRVLAAILGEQMWLCAVAAWLTLFFEVGSPLALVSRRLRPLFILGWVGLHVGIRLTMGPRYFENIIVFALLIHWQAVRAHGISGVFLRATSPREAVVDRRLAWSERAGVAFGSLLLPAIAWIAALQVVWWPVSNVYMYSAYYSRANGIRAGEPDAAYFDAVEAQRIARRFRDEQVSFDAMEHLPRMVELCLVRDGAPPKYLKAGVGTATAKQWDLVVELPVLIEDLAAKPHGRIEHDPTLPDAPANKFLRDLVPVIKRHVENWRDYDRVELVYELEHGDVAIARVPLDEP